MSTETEEAEGDNISIHCPCGEEWYFETAEDEPKEGTEIECDCGRVLTVTVVDWSAYVCASVSPPREKEGKA